MRPRRVEEAIIAGDVEALQRMGRAGGLASARNRQRLALKRGEAREAYSTLLEEEHDARRLQANEHICPIDEGDE